MQQIPLVEIFLIAIALGADAFSVSLAAGAQGFKPRRVFRLSWHFGLFQFMMPIIGWGVGDVISKYVGCFGSWAVMLMLVGIGGKMIMDGLKEDAIEVPDLSRGMKMVSLSIATSLDALGVGFGFGLLNVSIFKIALIIGVVCSTMTIIGLYLGVKIYNKLQNKALILGGVILIFIGVKMIV